MRGRTHRSQTPVCSGMVREAPLRFTTKDVKMSAGKGSAAHMEAAMKRKPSGFPELSSFVGGRCVSFRKVTRRVVIMAETAIINADAA